MESVDTYPSVLPLTTPISTFPSATNASLPRRTLSPTQEKEALIRKIEALSLANQHL